MAEVFPAKSTYLKKKGFRVCVAKVLVAKWYHLIMYPDWFRRLHQRPKRFLGELTEPGMTVAVGGSEAVRSLICFTQRGMISCIVVISKSLSVTSGRQQKM